MESKTPKFDALLDNILDDLVPHKRVCKWKGKHKYCEGEFNITKEDIEFLKLLRAPAPNYCPTCRRMNRYAFVNNIYLYKRANNAPGKNGNIISFVPPVSKLVVYDVESYKSDFDPYTYGTFYDQSKSFLDQFFDLRLKVPQPAIIRDPSNINSEYSMNGRDLKNGYYVSGGWRSENVWYSNLVTDSRNVMDSLAVHFIENSYELVSCEKCYNCRHCYFSDNCINSMFMYDCNNCQDCIGCVNLRNKSNYIFNIQYSKEEYKKKLEQIDFGSREVTKKLLKEFWKLTKNNPVRAERHENVYNVSGTSISNSRNCHDVLDCVNTENVLHCDQIVGHKDSMDASVTGGSERLYNTIAVGSKSANVKFSFASKFIMESEFVINCRNVNNCFACIGLENKSYCIFNRQYDKEEYYKELDKIKSSLLTKGEYGDFLPFKFSTFSYNGSLVEMAFPLERNEVEKMGALWQSETETNATGIEMIQPENIPDTIKEVSDDILDKAIICEVTGRPFKIIGTELEFYRLNNIPLPGTHQIKRMKDRFGRVGNCRVCNCKCNFCGKDITTLYNIEDEWNTYCDDCYKREIL